MTTGKKPIFIHSLFRTGSTYIWYKFRQHGDYFCYYEPLHPVLAQISDENIEIMLTRDYQSVHHPVLDNYYLYEYKPLLIKGKAGVPYFKKSFSYDEFCRNDPNPELKQYIDYLLAGAGEKIPLLQFNRTALRTRWFKTHYPESLNIYLVRNPRDQWQSYFELFKRTDYREFFVMDLLLISVNEDEEAFKTLSQHLPLIPFRHRDHAREKEFYRIILDSYNNEEKYFMFYYLWFKALAENLLNADLVIDMNRLSLEPVYKKEIIEFLNAAGISGIVLEDANLTEYSAYPLAIEVMAGIEDTVQKLLAPELVQMHGDDILNKLCTSGSNYFNFSRERFVERQEIGHLTGGTPGRIMEILKKMVLAIADECSIQIDRRETVENLLQKKIAAAPAKNLALAHQYWETLENMSLLTNLDDQLKKRDLIICEKDQVILQLEQELEKRHLGLAEKDNQVQQNNLIIREKDRLLLKKDQEIRMKAHQLTMEMKKREHGDLELREKTQELLNREQELRKLHGSYTYRTGQVLLAPAKAVKRLISKPLSNWVSRYRENFSARRQYFRKYERKIDLADQLQADFGRHRSGLKYGLDFLKVLHKPGGVVLDVFIERTFCWHPLGIRPHTKPWIGFIHVPPNVPDWFIYEQSNEKIFASEAWEQSFPHCRGLFTMSAYHRKYLEAKLSIPINNLIFPTEIPGLKWSPDRFDANKEKKIIQVGWWLRKLHAIFQLPQTSYKKVFLNVEHQVLPHLLKTERNLLKAEGTFNDEMLKTAEEIGFLPDNEYDRLLSENIVFIFLYDASANNTITECIARETPLLINPIEAVVEYLGEDYPFYYRSLEEAAAKAMDFHLVYKTHRYLAHHSIKNKLSGKYFLESLVDSKIYRDLEPVEKKEGEKGSPGAGCQG